MLRCTNCTKVHELQLKWGNSTFLAFARLSETGVKTSLATTLKRSKGGQFIVHAKALPGKPYDGQTLAAVIPDIERLFGGGA
jgi:hypothetical protein